MVRLNGKSALHLPRDYSPCSLILPTCLRATAQYLAQNPAIRGVFRVPGSVKVVNALFDYYCRMDTRGADISQTVRYAALPSHISCSPHDVGSVFKRFLSTLPGGILGSLAVFDCLVAIHSQLSTASEFARTKETKIRARLIALAIGTIGSRYRRELICAVFGLLSLIGRTAETSPREDDKGQTLPTSDLMGYTALGIIFGPLLVGNLLEQYGMQIANPGGGLVVFPMIPKSGRNLSAQRQSLAPSVDKTLVANEIAEMIISSWREVVRQMRALGVHRHRKPLKSAAWKPALPKSISDSLISHHPQPVLYHPSIPEDRTQNKSFSPEAESPLVNLQRRRTREHQNAPAKEKSLTGVPKSGQDVRSRLYDLHATPEEQASKQTHREERQQRLERLKFRHQKSWSGEEGLPQRVTYARSAQSSPIKSNHISPIKLTSHTQSHQPTWQVYSTPQNSSIYQSRQTLHSAKEKFAHVTTPSGSPRSKYYKRPHADQQPRNTVNSRNSVRELAAMFEGQNPQDSPSPLQSPRRAGRIPVSSSLSRLEYTQRSPLRTKVPIRRSLEKRVPETSLPQKQPLSGSKKPRAARSVRHATSDSGALFTRSHRRCSRHTEADDVETVKVGGSSRRSLSKYEDQLHSARSISAQHAKPSSRRTSIPIAKQRISVPVSAAQADDKMALFVVIGRLHQLLQDALQENANLKDHISSQKEATADAIYAELLKSRQDGFEWRIRAETAEKRLGVYERFTTRLGDIENPVLDVDEKGEDSGAELAEEPVDQGAQEAPNRRSITFNLVNKTDGNASEVLHFDNGQDEEADPLDTLYGDVAALWMAARELLEADGDKE